MTRRPGPRKAAVHFVRGLQGIGDFIAERTPEAAGAWVEKLLHGVDNPVTQPLALRVVPEVGRAVIREIHILTVFEGNRLYPDDVDE